MKYQGRILGRKENEHFSIDYFDAPVRFDLAPDGWGGTDLTLVHSNIAPDQFHILHAGWISVLMALKAAADHGIDLRNHDPARSWSQGYADQ